MSEFEEVDILLAEDSDTDGEMTLRALRKKGIANNVTWVRDGQEALDFIYYRGKYAARPNQHPKLVLLDLKMPRVDGIDVLRQIKGDPNTKTIPVVVLTSSAQDRDVIDSYQLGVNSYIVKPVDFDQFFEAVSKLGFYWAVMNKVPPSS
jgi:two-component system response regulator